MRFILYMLFGVGGVLVALALGMVFFSDDETAEVAPQTQSIDVLKSAEVDGTPARQPDVVKSETPSLDMKNIALPTLNIDCLLYTSPSPRDQRGSRMPSSA